MTELNLNPEAAKEAQRKSNKTHISTRADARTFGINKQKNRHVIGAAENNKFVRWLDKPHNQVLKQLCESSLEYKERLRSAFVLNSVNIITDHEFTALVFKSFKDFLTTEGCDKATHLHIAFMIDKAVKH